MIVKLLSLALYKRKAKKIIRSHFVSSKFKDIGYYHAVNYTLKKILKELKLE